MKNNISLLVGLKNNLDYNKHFYETTRQLYPDVEICFVSYGSTDGTTDWLDSLQDTNVRIFHSEEQKTFSDTFNKAAELATKDYVSYLHNDIVLAPGFIENLEKHIGPTNIVSYTTIEPPIFAGHERPGKIVKDFGDSLETFNKDAMFAFVAEQSQYQNKTEPGITFFMCMPRKSLLDIGGMDNLFNPMFCEDDDLIRRWQLLGMNCFTALDSICYHFVSKTSRFSDEYKDKTRIIEHNSNRNFIRKWGSRNSKHKYSIQSIIKNCNEHLLEVLEPWFSCVYIETDLPEIVYKYYQKEHTNTKYDLAARIKLFDKNLFSMDNIDILVEIDGTKFTQNTFNIIQQLPDIITESGSVGEFQLDNLRITITNMNTYEQDLVHL
jgi:GT2 family glycosyltransferase